MLFLSPLPQWLLLWLGLGTLLQQLRPTDGVCCPSRAIAFQLIDREDDCRLYDAKQSQNGICTMSICDDGTAVRGTYCGKGPCNIFGCNCENGCRKGNPLQIFQDYFGDYHIRQLHFV